MFVGAAIADAAGLGTIEIKAMKDHGYSTEFAVGVTAASATLGPIIPPSLPFVIYAMFANVSIGQLFLAGIVPGAVMATLMMLTVAYYAHKNNWGRDATFMWSKVGKAMLELAIVAGFPVAIRGATEIGTAPAQTFFAAMALLLWADRHFRFNAVLPILLPLCLQLGIDPVHFGLMMVLNLMLGLLHPPMGMVLFVLARVSKLSLERTTIAILPWLVPPLGSLILLTYVPEIALWLPRVFFP